MKPGDVVIGAFPGAQVTKTRPAFVLSTEDYHRHRSDVIVGIITTPTPQSWAPTDCALLDWQCASACAVKLPIVSGNASSPRGPAGRTPFRFGLAIRWGLLSARLWPLAKLSGKASRASLERPACS